MGRFESPMQVAGLFVAASVVSIGVIFFINAEAHSRLSRHPHLSQRDNDELPTPASVVMINDGSLSSVSESELTTSSSNISSSSPPAGSNVTLLNFLEDGLTKLLSLIKQAKSTYKSYYFAEHHHHNHFVGDAEAADGETSSQMKNSVRKKREVITRHRVRGRNKRAVISSKGRRIGENEPYYWQMLEDNEPRQQQNKDKRRHNQKELSIANTAQANHYPQSQPGREINSHYYQHEHSAGSRPAASAFTGGKSASSGDGHGSSSSITNPTSDFHKIRHAMNKLGGGGLDISVVERMILDTKSSRSAPSSSQHHQHHPGKRLLSHDPSSSQMGSHKFGDSSAESSFLTTATTKTTHQARQDESLYVNQLRHQQQQLAQSLLPPTVTWYQSGGAAGENSEDDDHEDDDAMVDFLPLPSSSLSSDNVNSDEEEDEDGDSGSEEENPVVVEKEKKTIASIKRTGSGRNNELSSPSSSSAVQVESDYHLPFTTEEEAEEDEHNNNSDTKNSNEAEDDVLEAGDSKRSLDDDDSPLVLMGSAHHNGKDCYRTDDVLIVVAITCCLNFAFVLVIWALVRWFSISNNPKEKDFQNLGDCDDTLDPTIVFHGVAEDPCWTLANSESGKCGDGLLVASGGVGMMTTRSHTGRTLGTHSSPGHHHDLFSERNTLSHHHHHRRHDADDIFPMMGHKMGTNPSSVIMSGRGHGVDGGILSNGGVNAYSFRPEHVPPHTVIPRSYSQSMEDLRYIQ